MTKVIFEKVHIKGKGDFFAFAKLIDGVKRFSHEDDTIKIVFKDSLFRGIKVRVWPWWPKNSTKYLLARFIVSHCDHEWVEEDNTIGGFEVTREKKRVCTKCGTIVFPGFSTQDRAH